MQNSIYNELKNKTVRDLYWLLFSPSPLSDEFDLSPFQLFPQVILDEWKLTSKDYFIALDKNAHQIEHFIGDLNGNRRKNRRLGFYAEALLSYFFQTFNSIELLLQNFQIIEEKRTIGEIDFIIRYKNKVIHIECAVKYYLLKDLKLKDKASQWVGPRLKDNLELKINKIIQHQLPLGKRPEIQEKINQSIGRSYLLLKGIFFTEKKIGSGRVNSIQPHQFIRISNLKSIDESPIETLSRPNWLSATSAQSENNDIKSFDISEFSKSLKNPELVMFNDGLTRFVVPDEWGGSIDN